MFKPKKESEHDEEPITIRAEEKEEMLQLFEKVRKDFEYLIGHVPEFDPFRVALENVDTRSKAVLAKRKRTAELMLVHLSPFKRQYRQYRSSRRYKKRAMQRKRYLKLISKRLCAQSNTPPPENSSETMRNVEMECDRSNEASGSVVKKVGTRKRSRLQEPEPVEDNIEEVELKSASKKSKKKKKSHKKSKKNPKTADTVSQDPNEGQLEVANEQSSEEVPVNFRLHNETEIIDVDAGDDVDQILYLNELAEEEQQKVRDEIEPQLSNRHMISLITLLRSSGKYRIVCRKSENKKADAPVPAVVIKEESHYLDIFDETEIIEVGSDDEEETKAFSDIPQLSSGHVIRPIKLLRSKGIYRIVSRKSKNRKADAPVPAIVIKEEPYFIEIFDETEIIEVGSDDEENTKAFSDMSAARQVKIKIFTQSDMIKIINKATGVTVTKILKPKPIASASTSEEENEIDQPTAAQCKLPKFNFDLNKNPFEIAKNNLSVPQFNVTSQKVSPTTSHNAGVFRFGSDSQMSPQGNSQQFVPPEGTSANIGEYSVGYVEEAAVKSEPEEELSSVKDEMLSDEYLSDGCQTISVVSVKDSRETEKIKDEIKDTDEEDLNAIPQPSTSGYKIKDEIEDTDEEDLNANPQPSTSGYKIREDSLAKDEAFDAMYSTMDTLLDDKYAYLNRGILQPSTNGAKATKDRVNNETQASAKALIEPLPVLRPWIKNDHLRFDLKQLEVTNEYLLMNFKCQGKTCTFATNNIMHLITHFEEHAKSCNELWYVYSCSYCRFIALDPNDYVQHFVNLHMSSRIQCAHCLFRAISEHEFYYHRTTHHESKDLEHFVVTQDICAAKSTDDVDLQVKCCGCSASFFSLESLKIHIEEVHSEEEGDDTCKYCGSFINGKLYVQHLTEEHNIGFFHCLDCQYGSNLFQNVTDHIRSQHADDAKGFTVRTLSG